MQVMRRRIIAAGVVAMAVGTVMAMRARGARTRLTLFIGTQSNELGQGIAAASLDLRTGALKPYGVSAEVARPTWLLADPDHSRLYAVSELGNAGDREGEVLSFAVAGTRLAPLGRTGSGGGGPTHLTLASGNATLFVANFGGGPVAAIPVAPDGTLASVCSAQPTRGSGPHRRQTGPHPHGVTLDPGGGFLLAPDMGADRVFVFGYDAATKSLAQANVPALVLPAGSGPRLLLFGRSGRHAYLLTELSSELFVYRWDRRHGTLKFVQSKALDDPDVTEGRSAAMLLVSPDGRFLYASNRRTNTIEVFAIDRRSGRLRHNQSIGAGGTKPWGGAITPNGRWLLVANQGSDCVNAFRIDRRRGLLVAAEGSLPVATPTAVTFVRA
jgi:6-phosphogluconolactonase